MAAVKPRLNPNSKEPLKNLSKSHPMYKKSFNN